MLGNNAQPFNAMSCNEVMLHLPSAYNQSMNGTGPSILDSGTKLKCNLHYSVCMSIIKLG